MRRTIENSRRKRQPCSTQKIVTSYAMIILCSPICSTLTCRVQMSDEIYLHGFVHNQSFTRTRCEYGMSCILKYILTCTNAGRGSFEAQILIMKDRITDFEREREEQRETQKEWELERSSWVQDKAKMELKIVELESKLAGLERDKLRFQSKVWHIVSRHPRSSALASCMREQSSALMPSEFLFPWIVSKEYLAWWTGSK